MIQTEDKLKLFQEAIDEEANKDIRQIQQEMDDRRDTLLTSAKQAAIQKADDAIEKAKLEITAAARQALSQRRLEAKRSYLLHRMRLEEDIFERVRKKLMIYAAGETYSADLCLAAAAASASLPSQPLTVQLRAQDMHLRTKLQAQFSQSTTVESSSKIVLGGMIVLCAGYVVDRTLDFALSAQRDWFHNITHTA